MANLLSIAARISNNTQKLNYQPINYCNCKACIKDYKKHYTHLLDCALKALTRINIMSLKINPLSQGYRHNNLSITKRKRYQNKQAIEEGTITFDPTITSKNNITECFRMFADPQKMLRNLAQRLSYD